MICFTGDKKHIAGRQNALKKLLNSIAADHKYRIQEIVYVFMDDEGILEINKQALKHDYYTDIITFDYSTDKVLEGEIYISVQRVQENAAIFKAEFHVELLRVICHGVLHMVGYKDKSKSDKTVMREKENYYIKQFK